ncbi:MAG: response regulator [Chloroflexi bacterium]|nr:response regulator [Chloroflexota bacterium]
MNTSSQYGTTSPGQAATARGQERLARVLVVDDEPTNRMVVEGMLTHLGYAHLSVENGAQAVEVVGQQRFDAVLMDCLMPIMDGYDATRAIRHREQAASPEHTVGRVPVIAVTALAMQGARERCIDAGMDDYLTKPVMLESLERVLDRWIAGEQAAQAWTPTRPAACPSNDGPIDSRVLDDLRELDGDTGAALIGELVHDFGSEVPARFPMILAAVTGGDTHTLLRELHFVAGCAAIVGARHVEQIARSVRSENAPTDEAGAQHLVERLTSAYEKALAHLTIIASA